MPSQRRTPRLGPTLVWLGVLLSVGLTLVVTISWGVARGMNSLWADRLAFLSFWVAVGCVPVGLAMVIAGLIVRGFATPQRHEIKQAARKERSR